eukprot:411671_1
MATIPLRKLKCFKENLVTLILSVSAAMGVLFIIQNSYEYDFNTNTNMVHTEYNSYNKQENIFNHYILFLRTFHGKKTIFNDDFFDTFKFFWPFNTIQANLLIVLDNENVSDHEYEHELRAKFESELSNEIKSNSFNYYITYEDPNPTVYHRCGWNRQQWSMLWADKFLKKLNIYHKFSWVGFVDTDTIFTSLITPKSIFKNPYNITNPKPITIVHLGFYNVWWLKVGYNTKRYFGYPEIFRHMSQFPATFKIKHIEQVRKLSLKYWFGNEYKNHHFDEIVKILFKPLPPFRKALFGQFNLFAIFAWNYAQNEYEWYIEPAMNESIARNRKIIYGVNGSDEEIYNFSSPDLNIHNGNEESMVRIAIHEKYTDTTVSQIIAKGYCFSIDWNSKYCTKLNEIVDLKDKLWNDLFEFQTFKAWSVYDRFRNQSLKAQIEFYKDVRRIRMNHNWLKPMIRFCGYTQNISKYIQLTVTKKDCITIKT